MKKRMLLIGLVLVFSVMFAGLASAHVTVQPAQTTQGSYEMFTVRVPSESKGTYTTKVEVKVADDVTISRVEPKADWTYELKTDATGKVTSVLWTAAGKGLSQTEFTDFHLSGKVGDTAASITWKAYQTYADGSVVEWTGGEGSDKPASVTKVNPKAAGAATDSHGNTAGGAGSAAEAQPATAGASKTPLYLSIAALVLAAAALVLQLAKRAK
ncbi:hypothetical protein J31TS4_25460 [Paenibacillus sp. J31TS4]|uniref:YcnI family copper-binding membrane protein n=1 Tax=Paenibacillus sp. J31TS4 TaxID=2807195 RepID=UPI001B097DA7|nr:YcnI family protein [Paenibacillus sp. J31TS4]GIP39266.1 hypothetical protein J31TS4_25460 [Paenibacillus sp. J31TS4]